MGEQWRQQNWGQKGFIYYKETHRPTTPFYPSSIFYFQKRQVSNLPSICADQTIREIKTGLGLVQLVFIPRLESKKARGVVMPVRTDKKTNQWLGRTVRTRKEKLTWFLRQGLPALARVIENPARPKFCQLAPVADQLTNLWECWQNFGRTVYPRKPYLFTTFII